METFFPLCTTTAKEEDITKNPLKPPMPPESVFCLILGYLSEVLYMSEGPCSLKTQFFVMEIFEKIQPID